MAKVTGLYKQNGVWMLDDASIAEGGYTQQYQMFATNKAIFYIDALIHSEEQATAFWNMRYKYGVLPLPKYDGEQKDYISYLQGDYACYSIPNHSNFNKYTSSATLEYLNFCSYKYTTIYYEEKIIKSQYLATKENAQVLDFVTERVNFDFAEQHGQMLNNAKDLLWTSVAKNGGTVSDVWTEQKETLTDALKQLDLWFMSKK